MKKLIPLLSIFIIIAIVVVVFISMSEQKKMVVIHTGNYDKKPVDIELHHFQDSQCGMTIESKINSVQVVAPDGRTWFFDDMGCMAKWYEHIKFKDEAIIWVYATDTKKYIDGRKAWYTRVANTPMHYGFGAYENKQDGFIDFNQVILHMIRGENLTNPYVKQKLLGNK